MTTSLRPHRLRTTDTSTRGVATGDGDPPPPTVTPRATPGRGSTTIPVVARQSPATATQPFPLLDGTLPLRGDATPRLPAADAPSRPADDVQSRPQAGDARHPSLQSAAGEGRRSTVAPHSLYPLLLPGTAVDAGAAPPSTTSAPPCEGVGHRYEGVDHRCEGVDHHCEGVDRRYEGVDRRCTITTAPPLPLYLDTGTRSFRTPPPPHGALGALIVVLPSSSSSSRVVVVVLRLRQRSRRVSFRRFLREMGGR